MSDATDIKFQSRIINMFKELMEIMVKVVQEDMMTMSHQRQNIKTIFYKVRFLC
jgi:hypothetical protein